LGYQDQDTRGFNHMVKEGLPPAVDQSTRILILGSMPSDTSIQRQQYYADSRNDFWKLISNAINDDISQLEYNSKIAKLMTRGIGLWDVYAACHREGSGDSEIRQSQMNDFSHLHQLSPRLSLVCFNGREAGQHESIFRNMGYRTFVLPSSSGANRKNSRKRLNLWKDVLSMK